MNYQTDTSFPFCFVTSPFLQQNRIHHTISPTHSIYKQISNPPVSIYHSQAYHYVYVFLLESNNVLKLSLWLQWLVYWFVYLVFYYSVCYVLYLYRKHLRRRMVVCPFAQLQPGETGVQMMKSEDWSKNLRKISCQIHSNNYVTTKVLQDLTQLHTSTAVKAHLKTIKIQFRTLVRM